jgi:hypothetical protein
MYTEYELAVRTVAVEIIAGIGMCLSFWLGKNQDRVSAWISKRFGYGTTGLHK